MMEKTGKVQPGLTPSEISGKTSETIKEGQAVRKDETPDKSTVEKVARLLNE